MDNSLRFRSSLLARWIPLLGLALPAAMASLSGCNGDVVVGSGIGGGGSDGTSTFSEGTQCVDPPPSTDPAGPLCPSYADIHGTGLLDTGACGYIDSGPTVENEQCCYFVIKEYQCGSSGRPYLVGGRAQTAAVGRAGIGWLADEALLPEVAGLTTSERAELAEAWARDGLLEHASVASFGRFALELLAVGAPAGLVADAHRAALDEVNHAKLCLGLASAYAGEAIVPGPFDFGRGVAIDTALGGLAARTFLEGCVGETLAAVQAAEQLAVAEDPAVRAVLQTIAEDEARHAELAWRTVAWALKSGGDEVRSALREALGQVSVGASGGRADATLRAHGVLDSAAVRASVERTLRDVVMPCARGLLESAARASEGAIATA